MAKYRITIETLEGPEFEGKQPLELTGFCLFGEPVGDDGGSTVVVQQLSMNELATHIAADGTLMPVAIQAMGMFEAYKATKYFDRLTKIQSVLGGLADDD